MEGFVRYLESVTTHFSRGQPVEKDRMENIIIKIKNNILKLSKKMPGRQKYINILSVKLPVANSKTLWGIISMCKKQFKKKIL